MENGTYDIPGLLSKLLSGEIPSKLEFINTVANMDPLQAVLILAAGLFYLLQGWKVFKILVVANAAALGATLGWFIGSALDGQNISLFGGIAGAMLFAVISWPLMKYAVSLMGLLVGGLLGYSVWGYVAKAAGQSGLAEYSWAGAIIGLIALGMLAFVVFQLTIMIFTSFQGALMCTSAVLALLMQYGPAGMDLQQSLNNELHLLPLVIGVPTVIGFACQYSAVAKKAKKKRRAEGGD